MPTTPELRREQIKLQVALITPLLNVKGYAALELKAAVEQARLLIEQAEALGEPPEDPLLLFSVLYGLSTANYVASNGDAMRELGAEFLALAEKQSGDSPAPHSASARGHFPGLRGDPVQARVHLDQTIALYQPTEHRGLATRFGVDARVSVLSYRSWVLWYLGYPQAALADADQAISDAREVGQAATLMYALGHAPFTYFASGDYGKAKAAIDELAVLADEKGALFFKAQAMIHTGRLFALTGKAADAVHEINAGLAAWRSTGAAIWIPLYLASAARAYATLGQFGGARRCIKEAMSAVETTKERWHEVEVYCMAGEAELLPPQTDMEIAHGYFERALTVARHQQAKSLELRAAMGLARLWRDQGKPQQARELLAPVYGWFTEGFDTRDLKDAKALLDEMAS